MACVFQRKLVCPKGSSMVLKRVKLNLGKKFSSKWCFNLESVFKRPWLARALLVLTKILYFSVHTCFFCSVSSFPLPVGVSMILNESQ